ncbi:HAD family hydrolase [Bosea rubneri]|uniref:HAD family hydrolase n=1 Tax=Bosea rubneri TaxID=3075434 RepID=A0ABU3SHV7_9HYPH|nr:HAD family hydrolase [Bosea sp. ZW T0_25]MDU0343992.1 HAD family hydrolase [Bosea sp. ZW T0_25]
MAKTRAICFDVFGTVLEVTDKRDPYRKLIDNEYDAIAVRALTHPLGIRDLAQQFDPTPSEDTILQWEADLKAECASLRLRPRMKSIWATLQRAQLQIGVCSNLAIPYAKPMLEELPAQPDGLVLSYRVGIMKPHKDIYQLVASQLELRLSEILFVGNHLEGDVWAPVAAGAHAMTVSEFETSFSSWPSIYAPRQVTDLFGRISTAKEALNSPAIA